MNWPSDRIREEFVRFFKDRGHTPVPSSSLLPPDQTLLFTNAGMNQFKAYFTGAARPPFSRAASVQKCMRAGGKHNDLDNVGFTPRHHTFFEMLGNFSFGDYFKKEAITWAWELLTGVLGMDPARLVVSVFQDDDEAFVIWRDEVGLPPERIYRLGKKDNFWEMGDVGPVGYSSEIYYDYGPDADPEQADPSQEGTRFLELWNLVFMQFYKNEAGELSPLPTKNIDTGAGLERVAAVLQGVRSNYDTDLFVPLIEATEDITGVPREAAHRVIADHARALVFAISDGIYPSNYGRGYVLRRILRRAHSFAQRIGVSEPVLYRLVPPVVELMDRAYPELGDRARETEAVIKAEEERFLSSIKRAMPRLLRAVDEAEEVLPGQEVFALYDTYGVPLDLLEDFAAQAGLSVDWEGFRALLEEQRTRARKATGFKPEIPDWSFKKQGEQRFVGYETLETETQALAFARGEKQDFLILKDNPFYPEAGGQLPDAGTVQGEGFSFQVRDVQRMGEGAVLIGKGKGEPRGPLLARVDEKRRKALARAHTGTHLLHAALREVLGEGALQRGSLVDEDRLRFDFSSPRPLSPEDLERAEALVNEQILRNTELITRWMDYRRAKEEGVMAIFEAKYGERVRVVEIPGFSRELCGGTHVRATGDIGLFKIISEEAVSAGVRRVEALVGMAAWREASGWLATLRRLARKLDSPVSALDKRADALLRELAETKKEKSGLSDRLAGLVARSVQGFDIKGTKCAAESFRGLGQPELRKAADALGGRGFRVVFLISERDGRALVHARVEEGLTDTITAPALISVAAPHIKARGGGKKTKAEGGGSEPKGADAALAAVKEHLRKTLGGS